MCPFLGRSRTDKGCHVSNERYGARAKAKAQAANGCGSKDLGRVSGFGGGI